MQTLSVDIANRSYPIMIGSGLLSNGALLRESVNARKIILITNATVAPLYADLVHQALHDREVIDVILADGEQHKTLATVSRVFDVLVANQCGRDAAVLALGGGVVGDLAGFAAACYQRGIDYFQLPTTLLAHVDSSVGGKTAVNHPGGKNLIGAFHQPRAVISDVDLLATLPNRELRAGLAEIIKYGLICDTGFLTWLESNMSLLRSRDPAALTHAIYRSCQIKAEIVGRDEREQGERALLNFGHTFGHAIEAATGYVEWLHGEAVGTGMLIAADMSRRMGLLTDADVKRISALLDAAGLPAKAPQCGAANALTFIRIDKKVQAGRVRLVLLRRLGEAYLTGDYPDATLNDTLAAHFG
jgi:3-dehydroquinate synthase